MAVSFDGIDDKLERTTSVISGTVFTVYCRFKLNSIGTTERIVGISNISSASNYLAITASSSNIWELSWRGGGSSPNASGWVFETWGTTDTDWHTLVFIARASNDYEIYFDNVLVATSSVSSTPSGLNRTFLGHWARSISSGFGNCDISEFASWTTDLSTDQVRQISGGIKGTVLGIEPLNSTSYIPLDDYPNEQSVDGLTFRDTSGNNNTLTGDNGVNNTGLISIAEPVMSYQSEIILPAEELIDANETDTFEISDSILVTDTIVKESDSILISDSVITQDTTVQELENLQITDSIIVTSTNVDAKFASKIISINPLIFVTDTSPIEIVKIDTTDPSNITWIIQTVSSVNNAKDIAINTTNDFIYIAGDQGQVVKVEVADLANQEIIDLSDTDDLLTIETNSNFGLTYAGTENEVGELYVIDERETFQLNSDLQVISPQEFQLESDFNIIETFKMDSNFQVLSEITFQISSDFKCLDKQEAEVFPPSPPDPSPPPAPSPITPLDTINPINLTDYQVFIDSVELEDTDLILNSISMTHSQSEQSTATFQLSRKHDQLNTTLKGLTRTITNQNSVEIKIKGRTEFNGEISEVSGEYNDDEEFVVVNALADEKTNQFNEITMSLPSLNERLSLYDILVQNPRIFNPIAEEDNEENPKKFKGIRVNLGDQITQSLEKIRIDDGKGNNATAIQNGIFNAIQNWTYFWGTINAKKFGNVKLGEVAAQSFFYIGTSLAPVSEDLWTLNNANHHRQRIHDDLVLKLGDGILTDDDLVGIVDNPTNIRLQLQNKGFLSVTIITKKFKQTTDQTELDLSGITGNEQSEVYEKMKQKLGFIVGDAPFKDISVRNGQKITKSKLVDEVDRLSSIKEAGFNFTEFAKKVAELEFEKLKNINGNILPDTSCTFNLTIDAYLYYGISLLTKINIDNTTETDIYNKNNGFPVSVKSITITSANRQVSLKMDNIKSTRELEEINDQFPDEEDDEYNEEEQRTLIAIKKSMRTGLNVQ